MMIDEAAALASEGRDLTSDQARSVIDEIFTGAASERQMTAYLTAMHEKPETWEELAASAEAFWRHFPRVFQGWDAVEVTGSGGDGLGSFNISTAAAFTAAAAGVQVVKMGNRAASGTSGSADVLEALGVNISVPPEDCPRVLRDNGIAFLFNQIYPHIMRRVAPVRRRLDFITLFNKLRWLNTSGASMQMLGVCSAELAEPLARALAGLGLKRGAVVHGLDGMDEVSVCGQTLVYEIADGEVTRRIVCPEQLSLRRCEHSQLAGGSPAENARLIRAVFDGSDTGPRRDAVVMNAAFAIHIAEPALTLRDAAAAAGEAIDSGAAASVLERFAGYTAGL